MQEDLKMPIGMEQEALRQVFRDALAEQIALVEADIAREKLSAAEAQSLYAAAVREGVVMAILANNERIEEDLKAWRFTPAPPDGAGW